MVIKMPRFTKSTEEAPADSDALDPQTHEVPETGRGITVGELEVVLGSLYTAPSMKDY